MKSIKQVNLHGVTVELQRTTGSLKAEPVSIKIVESEEPKFKILMNKGKPRKYPYDPMASKRVKRNERRFEKTESRKRVKALKAQSEEAKELKRINEWIHNYEPKAVTEASEVEVPKVVRTETSGSSNETLLERAKRLANEWDDYFEKILEASKGEGSKPQRKEYAVGTCTIEAINELKKKPIYTIYDEHPDWKPLVNPHNSVCKEVVIDSHKEVKSQQTFGAGEYRRASTRYTRYATRTIIKEDDWEQLVLEEAPREARNKIREVDEEGLEQFEELGEDVFETEKKFILNQVTLVNLPRLRRIQERLEASRVIKDKDGAQLRLF